jgi:hypothetical protein
MSSSYIDANKHSRSVHDNAILLWDIIISANIIYTAIVVPFRLGLHVTVSGAWITYDYVIDNLFVLNMLFSFFRPYEKDGCVFTNYKDIARHYISKWFIIDFISSVPFELILSAIVDSNNLDSLRSLKLIRLVRLFRLAKVIRVFRLKRKFEVFQSLGISSVLSQQLGLLIFCLLFVSHCVTCIFYSISPCHDIDNSNIPYDGDDVWRKCGTIGNLYSQYITGMYWSVQTLMSVGYGDINLQTNKQKLYSIIIMFIGGLLTATTVTILMKTTNNIKPFSTEIKNKMYNIKNYLIDKKIKHKLKIKIWSQLYYYYIHKNRAIHSYYIQILPLYLKIEILENFYKNNMKLYFIMNLSSNINSNILMNIVHAMQPMLGYAGDIIVKEGQFCYECFYIVKGDVIVFKRNRKQNMGDILVGLYSDLNCFGNCQLTHLENKSWATYMLSTPSDMLWFDRDVYLNICNDSEVRDVYDTWAKAENSLHKSIDEFIACNELVEYEEFSYSTKTVIVNTQLLPFEESDLLVEVKRMDKSSRSRSSFISSKMSSTSISYKSKDDTSNEDSEDEIIWEDDDICKKDLYRVLVATGEIVEGKKEFVVELESTRGMLHRGIINPHCTFKVIFDGIVVILVIGAVISLPLRYGFGLKSTTWEIYDFVNDAVFTIDLFLSFFTAHQRNDGILNTDLKYIAIIYIKGWFMIDFLSAFPFS